MKGLRNIGNVDSSLCCYWLNSKQGEDSIKKATLLAISGVSLAILLGSLFFLLANQGVPLAGLNAIAANAGGIIYATCAAGVILTVFSGTLVGVYICNRLCSPRGHFQVRQPHVLSYRQEGLDRKVADNSDVEQIIVNLKALLKDQLEKGVGIYIFIIDEQNTPSHVYHIVLQRDENSVGVGYTHSYYSSWQECCEKAGTIIFGSQRDINSEEGSLMNSKLMTISEAVFSKPHIKCALGFFQEATKKLQPLFESSLAAPAAETNFL